MRKPVYSPGDILELRLDQCDDMAERAMVYASFLEHAEAKIDKLERDNKVLKEALEFYAEPENWDEELMEGEFCNEFMLAKETGIRARKALSKIRSEGNES